MQKNYSVPVGQEIGNITFFLDLELRNILYFSVLFRTLAVLGFLLKGFKNKCSNSAMGII